MSFRRSIGSFDPKNKNAQPRFTPQPLGQEVVFGDVRLVGDWGGKHFIENEDTNDDKLFISQTNVDSAELPLTRRKSTTSSSSFHVGPPLTGGQIVPADYSSHLLDHFVQTAPVTAAISCLKEGNC